MAKTLAKVLKTDMSRLPLRKAAEELRKKGRGRDTMLAHITPQEAALLKARGGRGTINPETGLPEFDFWDSISSFFSPSFDTSSYQPQVQQPQFSGYTDFGAQPETITATPLSGDVTQPGQDLISQQDYLSNLAAGNVADTTPNALFQGFQPNEAQLELAGLIPTLGSGSQATAFTGPAGVVQTLPGDYASQSAALQAAAGAPAVREDQVQVPGTAEEGGGTPATTPEEQAKAVAAAKGIQTPFGTLGTKELIAALGLGGLGLNYLRSQQQGKSAAQQLQNAYNTAAAQSQALAQPFMQQGNEALARTTQGALTPASLQAYQAAQARANQAVAGSGGVGALQAGTALGNVYQNLLSSQQAMANSLLGAGTPLIQNAIQQQLAGTTSGLNMQMQLSQQAGQAASGMLGMLGALYGRG
jgi:hypothetical protein